MAYWFLFKHLWHYADRQRWKIALMVVCHVISLVAMLFNPYVFAQILNTLQLGERETMLASITRWSVVWVTMFLIFNLFHRIGRYLEYDSTFHAKQNFLNKHYHVVTHLSLKWHTDHHSGDTINRINTAANALQNFGVHNFLFITYFINFWGPLFALSFLSGKVALLAFAIALVTMWIIRRFDKALISMYQQINETRNKLAAILHDYISNIRTVITLRVAHKTQEHYNNQITASYKPYMQAEAWLNAWKWVCINFATIFLTIGVVFYYLWLQLSGGGKILIGNAAAVLQYLNQLADAYMNIVRVYQMIIGWKTEYEQSLPILDSYQQEHPDADDPVTDWQQIAIQNLQFSYNGESLQLDHIDLTLQRGERIALIGESGSGKSSLLHILRGLYKPSQAHVTIDHKSSQNLDALQDTTTLIPQDPEIFENTILYNITMGISYDMATVDRVIALARFDDVVKRLPNGLQTDVREKGVTLSGGEKQRLALARGLLAAQNSSIILLDEPTSSVDMQNEKLIYEAIFTHFAGQTIISSLHRVNLLSQFDRIVMMDRGTIIETGRYQDLTADPASHLSRYLAKIKSSAND